MKPSVVTLVGIAMLVGPVAISSGSSAAAATAHTPSLFGPPRELVQYGHIKSLTRSGARFDLRFDPAQWLGGKTANRAAVEDGSISPGEPVPNDYYIVDETHRLYSYRVPANAHVTVLTNNSSGVLSTRVSVAELAQLLRGGRPRHLRLMEPRAGFWIRIAVDTVRSLDQQYQP